MDLARNKTDAKKWNGTGRELGNTEMKLNHSTETETSRLPQRPPPQSLRHTITCFVEFCGAGDNLQTTPSLCLILVVYLLSVLFLLPFFFLA